MKRDSLFLTPTGLRFKTHVFPCAIGKTGLTTTKVEGDGATPRGRLTITGLLYRPDRLARPAPWAKPIHPTDLWSDAPNAIDYNTLVRAPYPASHEALRRADPLYDLILLTDWNTEPPIANKGSAIFIHQWRRPGFKTEGCIALSRAHLHWIAKNAPPGTPLFT